MSTPIHLPINKEARLIKIHRMPGHYVGAGDPIVDLKVDDVFRLTVCSPEDGKVMRCRDVGHIFQPGEKITEITGVGEPTWELFIAYRRSDSPGQAGRVTDRLISHFGAGQVFRDIESTPYGADYPDFIRDKLNRAYGMVVVIGPNWANDPKLQDPHDLHREEIRTAIERGIYLLPVLVQGATMRREDQVPEDIRPLVRRQAIEVRDTRWPNDVGEVMESFETILASSPSRARFLKQVPPWDHIGFHWIANNPTDSDLA